MWAPPIVMRHPLFPDDVQMPFVERHQKLQALTTQASAEPLAHRTRLRRPRRRAQNPKTHVRHCLVQFLREDAVPVVDQEPVGMVTG